MPRRLPIAIAGFLFFSIVSWRPPGIERSDSSIRPGVRSAFSEAALQALERENGCTGEEPEPRQGTWPDWKSATIAGGDVPPARVVSDAYPTFHSVAVDADRNIVVMSDPNRHA